MSTFYIDQEPDGTFRYTLVDDRGRTMLRSMEGYPDRITCEMGIHPVRKSASQAASFVLRGSAGRYSFLLKGAHGELLGASGTYAHTSTRKKCITEVQRSAPVASIVDRSAQRRTAHRLDDVTA